MTAGLPGDKPGATPAWGEWYRRLQPAAAHGQAVMSGPDGQPLLLLDRVGEGRAALLLSDQIWLWSRDHDGGGPQAELLRRVAHWLMKEPALEEEALTAAIENGTLSVERRTTSDAPPPPVTVTAPDGTTSSLALKPAGPGRAAASAPAAAPGVWQVSDGARQAFAAAGTTNPLEIADLRATATCWTRSPPRPAAAFIGCSRMVRRKCGPWNPTGPHRAMAGSACAATMTTW